jgi:hypothetical protein
MELTAVILRQGSLCRKYGIEMLEAGKAGSETRKNLYCDTATDLYNLRALFVSMYII